ncbi:MAG TPA: hypothetical protein VKD72_13960 [Gemmataceae bacterium]|nr:hypothetical protein [Gemmataceae bacterium]
MNDLVIQFHPFAAKQPCALCGQRVVFAAGPQLAAAERPGVVCRDCGKRHAPALAALVDLARAAERVGRIGRHTVCPPLTALLELSRAAENYAQTTQRPLRQAA